ncbi:hypothetical protein ARMGADRAFT_1032232 [Armillaria gallica]|uniref:Aminoacyl-tRNA synthetase class II (D/K/N) domain-containing protein n=1 Tax=Armillaria gallica TaxID=47427 RepID=A0A2H3DIL4_ARMGA|nr:hypothetical protein ARMGADRAFT_1032232 [Armillaria gallica]
MELDFNRRLSPGVTSQTYDALTLTPAYLASRPRRKEAPGGHEFIADHWKVAGAAPGADERRDRIICSLLRDSLVNRHLLEATASCLVQMQVEGWTTFSVYTTMASPPTSHRDLNRTWRHVCPVSGTYSASQSHTSGRLSVYTHLEAELAFISIGDIMDHRDNHLRNATQPRIQRRSSAWRTEHGIKHAVEDAEGSVLLDESGRAKMLKVSYTKKLLVEEGAKTVFTECPDLLMQNVGEIVGGSMRISDMEELLAAYKREGIDSAPYYWFADCGHGGYGLEVERFIAWLVNRWPGPRWRVRTRFFGRMVTDSGMLTVVTGGSPMDSITERRSIELYNHVSKSSADALSSSFIDDLATASCFQSGVTDRIKDTLPIEKGILGKALRNPAYKSFFETVQGTILHETGLRVLARRLGPVQMTTDTALGVTKLVAEDTFKIPYIDYPAITFNAKESVEMPSRYIAEGSEPKLPPGMRQLLHGNLNKSFDF